MQSASILAGSLAVLICAPASAAEPPSLPDPIMTPGAVDPAATRVVVCNSSTRGRRHVTTAMKAEVLGGYNIPDADSPFYRSTTWCRWQLGGANTVAAFWPEPWAEAVQKDALEVELQRLVCPGLLSQAEAQRDVADDWAAAYTRYVGGPLVVAPDPFTPVASAPPAARPTMKFRLNAEAWHLARRWILGGE